jgi:hypothetical protein
LEASLGCESSNLKTGLALEDKRYTCPTNKILLIL